MIRILVLSQESWRDDQNGGNVLSNIFDGFEAEFAQIFCSNDLPNNKICKKYFQLTDSMMLNWCIHKLPKKNIGKILEYSDFPDFDLSKRDKEDGIFRFKGRGIPALQVAREIAWKMAPWYSERLKQFVIDFDPDIIFAPCYGSHYMLAMTRKIAELCKKPVISYISDDFYTNKKVSFSIIFWINHFLLRRNIRKTVSLYELMYTMTKEQKEQCECDFGIPVKILCKFSTFDQYTEREINNPIRMIYAGGIYLNRWKTLAKLAKEINNINKNRVKITLDIYTNNKLSAKETKKIENKKTINIHNVISGEELKMTYKKSDIALHVEGLDLKNRLAVRMSFSTKIVDCIGSGCAIMAICDEKQAGYAYLKRNNSAICVSRVDEIGKVLDELVDDNDIIKFYMKQAYKLGKRNHDKTKIQKELYQDFTRIIGENE